MRHAANPLHADKPLALESDVRRRAETSLVGKDGIVIRLVHGPGPGSFRLRLWTTPDNPGPLGPGGLGVEWAGRTGHPTSYALLGGHLAPGGSGRVDIQGTGRYTESLAGQSDRVEFGLLDEYTEYLSLGLGDGVVVTVGAHGYVGSSPMAFLCAGRRLAACLRGGVPTDDADVLELWRSLTPEMRGGSPT